jgi:hypothetical protein
MDEKTLKEALEENRLFKIGNSFLFAVQIPDDTIGCSGSRCSNCNGSVAYCNHRCEYCGFPFVGPFGFPQLPVWETFSSEQKRTAVEDVYAHRSNRGRLLYTNVEFVPLTSDELRKVEHLSGGEAEHFCSAHSISIRKIRQTLFTVPS